MSPVLMNKDGFKIFFYSNEHEPKHVHVLKGDDYAKVNLEDLSVIKNYFKRNELRKALEIVENNRFEFIRRWDEYFKS